MLSVSWLFVLCGVGVAGVVLNADGVLEVRRRTPKAARSWLGVCATGVLDIVEQSMLDEQEQSEEKIVGAGSHIRSVVSTIVPDRSCNALTDFVYHQ